MYRWDERARRNGQSARTGSVVSVRLVRPQGGVLFVYRAGRRSQPPTRRAVSRPSKGFRAVFVARRVFRVRDATRRFDDEFSPASPFSRVFVLLLLLLLIFYSLFKSASRPADRTVGFVGGREGVRETTKINRVYRFRVGIIILIY